jgi:hypothetical protein
MIKPNFTGNYPMVQAVIAANAGSADAKSQTRRINEFVPVIKAAIEAGEITKSVFAELRSYSINRFVDDAFDMVIADKYLTCGKFQSLPSDLQHVDYLREARLIGGYEKKIKKLKHADHPMIKDIFALINELRELQDAVEYLKTVEISAVVKKAAVKAQKQEELKIRNQTDAVYQAVLPLKLAAEQNAELRTREIAARVAEELAEVGGNLNKLAPEPEYISYANSQTLKYKMEMQTRAFYIGFSVRIGKTTKREVTAEHVEELVARAIRDAALQFEAFVFKLNDKINDPVLSASLAGNAVWTDSYLTVNTKNKGQQVWHTQMILNVSKYGKVFNQFPTRLK